MAYEIPNFFVGVLPAEVDLSTKQFCAVDAVTASAVTGTDGASVNLPSGSGDPTLGILQNNPIAGEAAAVMCEGVSKALIQGSVSVGNQLMSVPSGKLAVATSGKNVVAKALEAGVDGNIVSVLLMHNGLKA